MSEKPLRVAIIIPAFNEENTIKQVVGSISSYGTVIVVNDASSDNTCREAKKMGAIVVTHSENKGYDEALNSGFRKASELNKEAVITFDADGQHSHELLPIFLKHLNQGQELVLGKRPRKQRISESLFGLYTKLRFGWSDPLCGMKGYNMNLFYRRGYFDSIDSIGTELAFFGLSHHFKFIEVSIPEIKRADSPRFHSSLKANYKIILSLLNLARKY